MLSYHLHALGIQCISITLFPVRSLEFEVVSDTNRLNTILGLFSLPKHFY